MMNKQTFKELIAGSAFKELFIAEMGWNNPQGSIRLPNIIIDDTNYAFEQIAVRSGFQVLSCKVDSIPTSSISKKIDTQLRKQANDYICIYYIPQTEHHLWVVPVKKVEKRDLVLIEYDSAAKAEFLYSKMTDLTFAYDDITTIMDVKEKVQAGFIINSEKITKDFYTGFRKEHTNFAKFITGIDDYIDEENKKRPKDKQVPNRYKQWYTSVMLNRLMFCYFIQKKGFLDRNVNYLRDKLAWVKNEKGENRFYGTFYQGFLLSLFHDGLNSPRHQQDFVQKYGRIPYLNGGMFSLHELEENYSIDIEDEAFESLFAFFDQWHWHLDDRLTASGKDINPDVLGYIFEQYINDRAQMGAYYTKEDITEYIGRNTILPFLMDATKKMDEKPFKSNGEVWQFLKQSGDTYIFDAVKKGADLEIPEEIAIGIDTTKPNLLERRSHWNEKTPEAFALPTEIWRETIERLQRYTDIKNKIANGELSEINDFITYNLDIRQFVQDFLAKTDDHLFVKHFYAQLRKVTILDPTCGSGAFLFAALNILEPLYEVCIDRMQAWNRENNNQFKEELSELNGKYRSNIRYFIYKNIILRNLYGVDIMVEATEIAKLRLFLKMVAVVDVNPREDNLGLDPLPDIDFNIRCGNTLVGYASNEDLKKDLVEGDMFAKQEFEEKVHLEMDKVARAYDVFKQVQLKQSDNLETYKESKAELKQRLKSLNDLLNDKLYKSTVSGGLKYNDWLKSHQPFHWLAEYYDIINGNKGFDVIVGNPPYIEYHANSFPYKISQYKTFSCGNLYAYVLERESIITSKKGRMSNIVPVSVMSTPGYSSLRNLLFKLGTNYYASFNIHPCCLFEGAHPRLAITLVDISGESDVFVTRYHKWTTDERPILFHRCSYLKLNNDVVERRMSQSLPKISSPTANNILLSMISENTPIANYMVSRRVSGTDFYYRRAFGSFMLFYDIKPIMYNEYMEQMDPTEMKTLRFDNKYKGIVLSVYHSSLFYWFTYTFSDCRNINKPEVEEFIINLRKINDSFGDSLSNLSKELSNDLQKNSKYLEYNYSSGWRRFQAFYPRNSKYIIDEIDKVLGKYYGFTEEELDFIINYDIKYRMGDELNEE